ncbi:hypothetical protein WFO77_07350 [Yersinia enterocolitica]|uniref:Uncharacterized protein n=2 Tax=Enterobacterales TaxID=91347 RepID=A0AAD2UZS1_YEREN|nr:hypothetical protein D3Z09_02745 [Rahnella aquatilis]EKN6066111.1 hypothetical protein [Yersinia enterocolitica]ELI8101560.1 hypothetical protein [Yersinia enterocolitica]HDL7145335.1 hypothetical protein [Yersinia enterocolitica]HDL7687723.1 hypothetical protein [Yersinia enterocolitica]
MDYNFKIKQVVVPLFGIVENKDQTQWLKNFSAPFTPTNIVLNDTAFKMIAENLGLDADGLAYSAHRYVSGQYRAETAGLSGSTLGDIGEVLTYLVNRNAGKDIVRVVSGNRTGRSNTEENKFPQPDFIVWEPGQPAAALEVKSTQALDYQLLLNANNWKLLQPCSVVKQCRVDALPQLGYIGGILTPQKHSLLIRDGSVVPFPIAKGIAVALASVDGRVDTLRTITKLKTPKKCRDKKRSCWDCLPENDSHFVLTTMPNSPNMLSLVGTPNDGGAAWIVAYRHWSESLMARDLLAAEEMTLTLARTVREWLDSLDISRDDVKPLREFWRNYVSSALASRGLDIGVPSDLEDDEAREINQPPRRSSISVAEKNLSLREVRDLINKPGLTPVGGGLSFRVPDLSGSLSFFHDDECIELRMMSSAWWSQEKPPISERYAQLIAAQLLAVSLGHENLPTELIIAPLRKIEAKINESAMLIGWEWDASTEARGYVWPILSSLGIIKSPPHRSRWLMSLLFGDPRALLRIAENGRGILRIHKSIFE